MARDKEEYAYYLVGIHRNSSTHQALLADAKGKGVKQLPVLIGIRLGDYYEMMQRGQHAIISNQQPPQSSQEEEKPDNGYSPAAQQNATQALDMWN